MRIHANVIDAKICIHDVHGKYGLCIRFFWLRNNDKGKLLSYAKMHSTKCMCQTENTNQLLSRNTHTHKRYDNMHVLEIFVLLTERVYHAFCFSNSTNNEERAIHTEFTMPKWMFQKIPVFCCSSLWNNEKGKCMLFSFSFLFLSKCRYQMKSSNCAFCFSHLHEQT